MAFVRALIQEYKPGTIDGLVREAQQTFIPRVQQIPGFVSHQIIKVDERTVIAISTADTRAAAEQIERVGAEWRKKYGKDAIVSARPMVGEIVLDTKDLSTEAHPTH